MPDWIAEGEKFALIGLDISVDTSSPRIDLPGGLSALSQSAFQLPDHWKEWLGSLQAERVQSCSLYIVAKMPSAAPTILDGESRNLQERVGSWYHGLLLTRKLREYDEPFIMSGGTSNGEVDIRSFTPLVKSAASIVNDETETTESDLAEAALAAMKLAALGVRRPHWRFLRCLEIYFATRTKEDILDRIHQFTRCIEGLILPKQGDTKKQFKSRTELFIGPRYHSLMGEMYEVRSDIEHLHENKHLETFDRDKRIWLASIEARAEWIARSCLRRIVMQPGLLDHFGSVTSLQAFWAKPADQRRAIWGEPIDPCSVLNGFSFAHVSDELLGAR